MPLSPSSSAVNRRKPKRTRGEFGQDVPLSAIAQYLEDISQFDLLTDEREAILGHLSRACELVIERIGAGDEVIGDCSKSEKLLRRYEATASSDADPDAFALLCAKVSRGLSQLAQVLASNPYCEFDASALIADAVERVEACAAEHGRFGQVDLFDDGAEKIRGILATLRVALEPIVIDGRIAQKALVNHNLRLVVTVSKDFRHSGIPLLDLIQAGNEGLMHASRKFDPSFGTPFGNYSPFWVKQRLMKYTTEHGFATRVPPHRSWSLHRIQKVSSQLMQRYGRAPTAEEVAEETGYDMREVQQILAILQADVQLDQTIKGDPGASELGMYFGESRTDASDREQRHVDGIAFARLVERALGVLTDREAELMRLHYGLEDGREWDLQQIGKHFGFTRERARQIRATALEKIRESGVVSASDLADE